MNRQDIFNKVVTHLRAQGRCAFKKDKTTKNNLNGIACRYRQTVKGKVLKCAIGALIPDDLYNREMDSESMSADTCMNNYPAVKQDIIGDGEFSFADAGFLTSLQRVHDSAAAKPIEEQAAAMECGLAQFARANNLTLETV